MSSNLALEIKSLNKIYNPGTKKEVKALSNINLNVKRGDFFGLLGPNGAGKSTLINCLATIVNKTSGYINISGYSLDKEPILAKKSLGIVPQELNFDPFFTPLQILMLQQGFYGITPNKAFCMHLLHLFGLKGKENAKVRSLSGGMKRRVLIAKALVHSPDTVILDEPTAGVDVDLRKNIWERLNELNKSGTTIILTTHYLEEAQFLCKKVAIINKGKVIVNEGTEHLINRLGAKVLTVRVETVKNNIPNSLLKYYIKRENTTLYFSYIENNGFIIKELLENHFNIINIKTQEADLEEVFIKLIESSNHVPVAHLG